MCANRAEYYKLSYICLYTIGTRITLELIFVEKLTRLHRADTFRLGRGRERRGKGGGGEDKLNLSDH